MTDSNPNRHLSGPKGGQFAEKHQSEAANVSLKGGPAHTPKIMATVNLQRWVDDGTEPVGQIDFDAGRILAAIPAEKRNAIRDGDGSSDDVFHEAVRAGLIEAYDGPFEVYGRDSRDEALEEDPDVFEKLAALPDNRPPGAVLEAPLSAYEIGARADGNGVVSGLSVMSMSELIDNDIEGINDRIGNDLVGSELLMEPTATPVSVRADGALIVRLEGDATEIINGFDGDARAEFEAGRAARPTEGAS